MGLPGSPRKPLTCGFLCVPLGFAFALLAINPHLCSSLGHSGKSGGDVEVNGLPNTCPEGSSL